MEGSCCLLGSHVSDGLDVLSDRVEVHSPPPLVRMAQNWLQVCEQETTKHLLLIIHNKETHTHTHPTRQKGLIRSRNRKMEKRKTERKRGHSTGINGVRNVLASFLDRIVSRGRDWRASMRSPKDFLVL